MGQLWLGVALVLLGSFLAVPAIILLGLVLALVDLVRQLWARRGLEGVEYARRLPHPRGVVGDEIPLDITVWNRKALPLAWLRVEDEASAGVEIRERELRETAGGPDVLRNAWTLAPYERVVRHFHVVARRRGVYALGPGRIEVGDLFAQKAAEAELDRIDRWLVRPRTVAVRVPGRDDPWGGELHARRGLIVDPTRYAGVRPYQPGDPVRAVHWRATARLGTPVTRLFEPGRHRELVLAVDVQTVSGEGWLTSYDDDAVEDLCVATASLARQLLADGASVGLAAAAYTGTPRSVAYLAPGASDAQLGRCLDLLARLAPTASTPFEHLLTGLLRILRPATSLLVVTARDDLMYLPALRRMGAAGHPVQLVGVGDAGAIGAAAARHAGIDARPARLDGPWTSATALLVA